MVVVRWLQGWAKIWSGQPKDGDGVSTSLPYGSLNGRAGHPGIAEAHDSGIDFAVTCIRHPLRGLIKMKAYMQAIGELGRWDPLLTSS